MRSPYTTSDAVIIEKVIGEPPPKTTSVSTGAWITITAAMAVLIGLVWLVASGRLVNSSGEKFSAVKEGGCDLRVVSLYDQYGTQFNSPWRIKDRIFNAGTQGCIIQFGQISQKGPFTIGPGDVFEREWIIERVPVLVRSDLSVGLSDGTMKRYLFRSMRNSDLAPGAPLIRGIRMSGCLESRGSSTF